MRSGKVVRGRKRRSGAYVLLTSSCLPCRRRVGDSRRGSSVKGVQRHRRNKKVGSRREPSNQHCQFIKRCARKSKGGPHLLNSNSDGNKCTIMVDRAPSIVDRLRVVLIDQSISGLYFQLVFNISSVSRNT